MPNWLLPLCGGAVLLIGLFIALYSQFQTKKTLTRLNTMLDAAMQGTFHEGYFDESLLSAVETKLAHFLAASHVSAAGLQEERQKITQLIADISHQTKTPISNLLLYAQLLEEQPLSQEGRTCVTSLTAQAEKLQFLIQALIKTSRLETGVFSFTPTVEQVYPMVQQVLEEAAVKAENKHISFTFQPSDATACFDPKWTGEALYNIVDNAVKYTPEGGSVHLSITPYQLFCRIDIADTGMGIAPEEQTEVFKRFYRSAAASQMEGVGIGLYLSRQIISAQGGYIKVTSIPQKGSVFSVFLPQEP